MCPTLNLVISSCFPEGVKTCTNIYSVRAKPLVCSCIKPFVLDVLVPVNAVLREVPSSLKKPATITMCAHITSFSPRAFGRRVCARELFLGGIKKNRSELLQFISCSPTSLKTEIVKSVQFLVISTGDSSSLITVYSDWLKID